MASPEENSVHEAEKSRSEAAEATPQTSEDFREALAADMGVTTQTFEHLKTDAELAGLTPEEIAEYGAALDQIHEQMRKETERLTAELADLHEQLKAEKDAADALKILDLDTSETEAGISEKEELTRELEQTLEKAAQNAAKVTENKERLTEMERGKVRNIEKFAELERALPRAGIDGPQLIRKALDADFLEDYADTHITQLDAYAKTLTEKNKAALTALQEKHAATEAERVQKFTASEDVQNLKSALKAKQEAFAKMHAQLTPEQIAAVETAVAALQKNIETQEQQELQAYKDTHAAPLQAAKHEALRAFIKNTIPDSEIERLIETGELQSDELAHRIGTLMAPEAIENFDQKMAVLLPEKVIEGILDQIPPGHYRDSRTPYKMSHVLYNYPAFLEEKLRRSEEGNRSIQQFMDAFAQLNQEFKEAEALLIDLPSRDRILKSNALLKELWPKLHKELQAAHGLSRDNIPNLNHYLDGDIEKAWEESDSGVGPAYSTRQVQAEIEQAIALGVKAYQDRWWHPEKDDRKKLAEANEKQRSDSYDPHYNLTTVQEYEADRQEIGSIDATIDATFTKANKVAAEAAAASERIQTEGRQKMEEITAKFAKIQEKMESSDTTVEDMYAAQKWIEHATRQITDDIKKDEMTTKQDLLKKHPIISQHELRTRVDELITLGKSTKSELAAEYESERWKAEALVSQAFPLLPEDFFSAFDKASSSAARDAKEKIKERNREIERDKQRAIEESERKAKQEERDEKKRIWNQNVNQNEKKTLLHEINRYSFSQQRDLEDFKEKYEPKLKRAADFISRLKTAKTKFSLFTRTINLHDLGGTEVGITKKNVDDFILRAIQNQAAIIEEMKQEKNAVLITRDERVKKTLEQTKNKFASEEGYEEAKKQAYENHRGNRSRLEKALLEFIDAN
ncbi:MAG: hypothetical protein HOE53_02550 [Candidatus Magasanikbacteria bacterium]|jgi:hypothetical protein|nr:hypothetical protein [Candidatus Magasanikbacteria bacterium]